MAIDLQVHLKNGAKFEVTVEDAAAARTYYRDAFVYGVEQPGELCAWAPTMIRKINAVG